MKKVFLNSVTGSDISVDLQLALGEGDVKVLIPPGDFLISKTIYLPNNVSIVGSPDFSTKITLGNAVNSNMFTNKSHLEGGENISVGNLWLDGNAVNQFRPHEQKKLSFCNIFYFSNVFNIDFLNIKVSNCKQTALHFNKCLAVKIDSLNVSRAGWSGISTSGSENLEASNVLIYDSGKDVMHSAVHFDGGKGIYFDGEVEKCTGNGVMLDSKFSFFRNAIVSVLARDCKRGISLSGDHNNGLSNILVKNSKIFCCETGIMVSNAKDVFIVDSYIEKSFEYGVLLQGKYGGCYTIIANSKFKRNRKNITEIHASNNNFFVKNDFIGQGVLDNKLSFVKRKLLGAKKQQLTNTKEKILDQYSDVCTVCGEESKFCYNGGSVRESYRCFNCNASLRHRGLAKTILDIYSIDGVCSIKFLAENKKFNSLKIYEPGIIGPFRKYFKNFQYYFQSYYWDDYPLGDYKENIQNQNLECLTFSDNFFDLIITADIFEHVRKPWDAFREVKRVLKPGGRHIFTIPVQFPLPEKTVYRVDTSTDFDKHILPERYHIAGDGSKSLVYNEFGSDMLNDLNAMGLKSSYYFIDENNKYRKKNITFVSLKK